MVNTRSKTQKTQNLFKTGFLQDDSDEQSTGSVSLIGSNDDLLYEILVRLPVTSILRFKSVSKHWRFLLSHRHFTLRYDKLPKSPGLFVNNDVYVKNVYVPFDVENPSPTPFVSLDFYPDPYGIIIVQSCNGLLLCCSDDNLQDHIYDIKYYVFNPTTKQFAIIPSLPGGLDVSDSICFMGLAFHQTDCIHYKVICVLALEPEGELFQIQIYSSDTGNWKISVESFSADYPTFDTGGVYWNGAIHWHRSFKSHLHFKVETEQLRELPLRLQVVSCGGYFREEEPTYFGESRGHLHLGTLYHSRNDLRLNVYVLSSDLSGWFVKYQVESDELLKAFPEMRLEPMYLITCKFRAIDVVRGEKEEDTFVVVKIPDEMRRYNVHDKSFKKISTFTQHVYGTWLGHRYIELLSSF